MPLLPLPGLAIATATGCAGVHRGADPATVAAGLQASLASTRASLAALDPEGRGAAGDASPPPPAPEAAVLPPPHAAPPASEGAWRGVVSARPHPAAPPDGPLAMAAPGAAAGPRGAGPPPSEAAELLGLPAESVLRRLGAPALRRPEGPAEVWLYTARSCALDVILYRDDPAPPVPPRAAGGPSGGVGAAGTGALRVAFAAARAAGTEPRSEAACLREIAGGSGPEAAGEAARREGGSPMAALARRGG